MKIKEILKHNFTFANVVILFGLCTTFVYVFSYLFPVTDNSFVVNNVRPVASLVKGYVTNTYVKNGQKVKKGELLFTVFDKQYQYTVEQYKADLLEAKSELEVLNKTLDKDIKLSNNYKDTYIRLAQDDEKYKLAYKIEAVSLKQLQNSEQETKSAKSTWEASQNQVEITQKLIAKQGHVVSRLEAKLRNAEVDLELTKVYAETDGIIQNFYLSKGTPVNVNEPLFSFINTDEIFFQANFNETDLADVHEGSEVYIFPRIYLGRKIFHGVVVSDYWAANRQLTDPRTQMQNVTNENEWVLLPQRLPVQIKVTDPDPKYPLRAGISAYIYIKN